MNTFQGRINHFSFGQANIMQVTVMKFTEGEDSLYVLENYSLTLVSHNSCK